MSSTPTRAAWPCPRRFWCSQSAVRGRRKPLLTLNPALVVSGYWTSAIPEGYSNSVEILASGTEVPGWLEPGESITVPVYYAGMQQPWTVSRASFQFNARRTTLSTTRRPSIGAACKRASSRRGSPTRPGRRSSAASTSQLGDTWGGYVTMLDDEASYLGQLGEDVTDVSELWAFAVMQADGLTPTPVLASVTDLDVAVPGQLSLDFSADLSGTDQRARCARPARLRLDRRLAVFAERRPPTEP